MKFERIKYPDGQISAKMVDDAIYNNETHIKECINSYEDLVYVASIGELLTNMYGPKSHNLFIPCLFGQRSDRRFSNNQSFDLKVITNVINLARFKSVMIFHPHSSIPLVMIDNAIEKDPFDFVAETVHNLNKGNNLVLVSPDAGAYKRTFEYGEKLNLPVVAAVKHRDKDGKIDLTFTGDVAGKDCLIVDDLADGAYTFELLGRALRDRRASRVYLYVSHGLFSKGFDKLKETIDHVYCTNSIKDITDPYVTQYKII